MSAVDKTTHIQNWLKDEEAKGIEKVSSLIKNGFILEVGTGMGRSAAIMALASPTSRILTIDNLTARAHENMDGVEFRKRVISDWHTLGIYNIELLVGNFRDLNEDKLDPIDLLFIEGKQTFVEAVDTYNKFQHRIKPKGYIMIRDYLTRNADHEHFKFVDNVLMLDKNYRTTIEGHFVYAQKIA